MDNDSDRVSGPIDLRDWEGKTVAGCESEKCNRSVPCYYFPACPHQLACRAHSECLAMAQHVALYGAPPTNLR